MDQKRGLSSLADRAVTLPAWNASVHPAAFPESRRDRWLRCMDMVLALILLLLILPVMALIALAIKCTSAGPVLFVHDRVGRGGGMFPCLKFRTMTPNADERLAILLARDPVRRAEWMLTHKLRCDPRITPVGKFLRTTSLDELPQLLNVLRGDMSLVGPRPIVPAEVFRYGRYIDDYCSVRPGITGLWQINGRSDVDYSRRVALDVLYIRSRSLPLYIYILGVTIPRVIVAEGTY